MLELIEKKLVLRLRDSLIPGLSGLVLALLPGMEEPGTEGFDAVRCVFFMNVFFLSLFFSLSRRNNRSVFLFCNFFYVPWWKLNRLSLSSFACVYFFVFIFFIFFSIKDTTCAVSHS